MRVCQILHENGFEDITLPFILSISTFKLYDLMVYIHIDLLNILMHHKRSRHSRYSRYTATVRKDLEMFDMSRYPTEIQIPTTLMLLLNDMYDVFPVASIIARALARM